MGNQKDMEDLFKNIACCKNVCDYFNRVSKERPCCKIIESQNYSKSEFQIPEPWSGHIDKAPLLFLGSNPSIDADEKYPKFGKSCCSKQGGKLPLFNGKPLIDFYDKRFDNTKKEDWKNGGYWKKVDSIASWLYSEEVIGTVNYFV